MSFNIRPYHPSDLPALYQICLKTGDNGGDATGLFNDPELLGHYFAAPYAVLEPDLCFILTKDHRPIGYVLGTRDTATFGQRCETEWFPPLRLRYPLPAEDESGKEARMIRSIHGGHDTVNHWPDFPAHLHIDIMPEGQNGGWGRKLMETLWERLREIGTPGVFLGVSKANSNAVGFYQHIGFETLEEPQWGYMLGKRLNN